tara:strand:- start:2655 stop:3578 length:924 start_codon:yes stop_codon:yes gene_type:complete
MTEKQTHIAVLMGGWSSERDVSLVSGNAVAKVLGDRGYKVSKIDVDHSFSEKLKKIKPDAVFNALHGRWGEDGCVQGALEILKIPYTHSGVLASAIAMNKPIARRMFISAGIQCPDSIIIDRNDVIAGKGMEPPFVVKPINEGSSVGVIIVTEKSDLSLLDSSEWIWGEKIIVERFIPGRDIQVAVMGDKAIGAIEIRPKGKFYDYESKYTPGRAEHFMPAPIHPDIYSEALSIAETSHCVLGCRGVTRADLRYDDSEGNSGKLYMLEINTQPGMTPLSLVPEIAADVGIEFPDLVQWMIKEAKCDN